VSAAAFRVVLRYLYTAEVPTWAEAGEGGAGSCGGGDKRRKAGGGGAGGKRGDGGRGGKGKGKEEGAAAGGRRMKLEVLKAADLLRAEGLLQHCLEGFREALTVATAVEQLVWAQQEGPAEARAIATDYFVANCKAIRVRAWTGGGGWGNDMLVGKGRWRACSVPDDACEASALVLRAPVEGGDLRVGLLGLCVCLMFARRCGLRRLRMFREHLVCVGVCR
jgi:hypothetical protein